MRILKTVVVVSLTTMVGMYPGGTITIVYTPDGPEWRNQFHMETDIFEPDPRAKRTLARHELTAVSSAQGLVLETIWPSSSTRLFA